jgi:hypothetical protein
MMTKCGNMTVVEQADTPGMLVPAGWPMVKKPGQLANQLDK